MESRNINISLSAGHVIGPDEALDLVPIDEQRRLMGLYNGIELQNAIQKRAAELVQRESQKPTTYLQMTLPSIVKVTTEPTRTPKETDYIKKKTRSFGTFLSSKARKNEAFEET